MATALGLWPARQGRSEGPSTLASPRFGAHLERAAKGCHSLVVRCPGQPDVDRLRANLKEAIARRPALKEVSLWLVREPSVSGEAGAGARTRLEAERPLPPDRAPLRVVLIRHADGVADAVFVADRSRVPRTVLTSFARAVVEGVPALVDPMGGETVDDVPAPSTVRAAEAVAPPWGCGDPRRKGQVGTVTVTVTLPPGEAAKSLLSAATIVVLSRYADDDTACTAVLGADGSTSHRFSARGAESVRELLDRIEQRPVRGEDAAARALPDPAVGLAFGNAEPGCRYLPALFPPFPLTFSWEQETGGASTGVCRYDEGAVHPSVAEAFVAQVTHVAGLLAGRDTKLMDMAVADVVAMSDEERQRILRLGSTAPVRPAAPADSSICHRLQEMARRRPEATAVTGTGTTLTYRQLDEQAERIAQGLRARGVRPGDRVGVCLEREPGLIVALLAVLKTGCAYVPMDTRYPAERLRYVVTHANLPLVVADPDGFPRIPGVEVVGPEELSATVPSATGDDRSTGAAAGERPAYVIYTSGSTGRPKGVVVPHHNVLALVDATRDELGLGPSDVWTVFHSTAFDFSVWEIWGCLLTGGRLVVVPFWATRAADRFHRLLAEEQVTVLSQTPLAFQQLAAADRDGDTPLSLRLVVFGGDTLEPRTLLPWFSRHPHTECRMVNMFGITETTVHVTARTVTPELAVRASRSVGRALPGWSVSVRDPRGRVLPLGAEGEIWVGGAGVAGHYLGDPALTAERFVVDPVTGDRLYRSGDRGRMHPCGSIDHLGRIDNQVKVRGHRVELDEIQAVLMEDASVTAAAVVLTEEPDDRAAARIDAYAVLRPGTTEPEILARLRRTLPAYMVPAAVTAVPSIPLTVNGKLERAALPAPRASGPVPGVTDVSTGSGQPDDEEALSRLVLRLWSRCLRTEVRLEDNFFECGGNSLLVVRLVKEMRAAGLPEITVRDFYRHSTAAKFVELVRRTRSHPDHPAGG